MGPIRGLEELCTARTRLPIVIYALFIRPNTDFSTICASWNRGAGDDKGSGGHELQPCATLGLLRISFIAHADGHLRVVEQIQS